MCRGRKPDVVEDEELRFVGSRLYLSKEAAVR